MKKKLIILFILIFIIAIWQMFQLYVSTMKEQNKAYDIAAKIAKEETEIQKVTKTEFYYGKKAYYLVYGKNKENQNLIAWVPENYNGNSLTVKQATEGLTKKEVEDLVITKRNPLELLDIRLGMEDNVPLWEVTYIDQQNRFTYYYVDFKSGKFLKRYSLKKDHFKGEF